MEPPVTPPADTEQPTVPNGAGGEGGDGLLGLYDLSTAPEELRPHLEAELKKIVGNVGKRFEAHAEERKQWEPIANIDGLRDVPAEELTDLLQFREIASDPQQLENWWVHLGNEMGWFDGEDGPDSEGADSQATDVQSIAQQVLELLKPEIEPLKQHISTQEQQRRTAEAEQKIQGQLDELEGQHGEFDREAVLELAAHYMQQDDPNAIQRGFERYMQITGKAKGELVDSKLNQPAPGLNGGHVDTTPEKITSFADAKRAALARL